MATHKILGQATSTSGSDVDVYTAPAGGVAVSTIHVVNRGTSGGTFKLAVIPSGQSIGNSRYIAFNEPVSAERMFPITTGVTLASGDKLVINASSNDFSVSVFGAEGVDS